jgi:GUN4-like
MQKQRISLSTSFESWVKIIQSLDFDQLLKVRDHVRTSIERVQAEVNEDKLVSESEVDYTYLQALLAQGAWQEADEETTQLMLEAAGQDELMFVNAAENFPISDLKTIDQLWVKYSNGRFGLSVQKQLWQEVEQDIEKFGAIVGWCSQGNWLQESNLKFTYEAPVGHLPFVRGGLSHEAEIWSAEYFTDSEGEDQGVETAEPVESMEMWKVFANLLTTEKFA